uniref:Tail protein n=1 Tax=viral metagenome TaxID=1070528 RepID=A0A6H1ZSN6_9ZZZZ
MKFTSKDGELRLYEGGAAPHYLVILFTNADLNFPLNRGKSEEVLVMDRGNMNTDASYRQGSDDGIMAPLPVKFSGLINDAAYTHALVQLLSGSTSVGSAGAITTAKATSSLTIAGASVATKAFADSSKRAYNLQIMYDGTTDFVYDLKEVYFPPDQQTITEGEDGVTLDANGLWYGSGGTKAAFTGGTAIT